MSWIERNPDYQGRQCIVCSHPTREQCAPLGILSGRMPCHSRHTDREIRSAYLAWASKQYELPEEGPANS